MSNPELIVKLRDLHEELSSINIDADDAEEVDEETIDALGQLATDIGQLVEQAKLSSQKQFLEEHKNLADRIVEFERNHPQVSRFLSQMTDLLAMMGI